MKRIGIGVGKSGGVWRAWWYDSLGVRRFKSLGPVGAMSRSEAQNRADSLLIEFAKAPRLRESRPRTTLSEWLDNRAGLQAGISESTRVTQAASTSYIRAFFGSDVDIAKINRAHAAGFRVWLATHDLSSATMHRIMAVARQTFEHAFRLDLIPFNPFDREKIVAPRLCSDWRYVPVDEVLRLADELDPPTALMVALARLAGLRRNEIIRLRWDQVSWSAKTISVRGAPGRGRGSDEATTKRAARVVPMSPELLTRLEAAFLVTTTDSVFNGSTNNVERRIVAACDRAGLVPWSKPLHTLRKSLESDWLKKYPVMDVCKWMGNSAQVAFRHYHKTLATTMAEVSRETSPVIH